MQAFITFFRTLGITRIIALGGVGLALMGFFAFLIMRAAAPQMVPLFTDLSVEDSSAIIKDLERQGIPYDLKSDGAIVLVPREQVPRLRMKLAESGLPKGGGVGYEIFDKSDALGATSFVQNINHLRALEGELARTIRAIDRVQQARVHLVLPERPLFSRDKAEPSASIVLKVRGALEQQQVRAIRHLVATAVNGLKPQRVSVIDEAGRLLADGNGDDAGGGSTADERKTAAENRMRQDVEAIVTSVVGPGRAQVRVNIDFDFNRVTQTTDRFDPESRVVRSSQTREESSGAADAGAAAVSVGNDLPGGAQRNDGQPPQKEQNRKTEEVVNYEISRTTKTEVIEGGRINRLSVAVVVDGNYAKNDKGETVYQPRSQEEIDRIAALVRSTVNFDAKRGDQVEVANLRLAETPSVPAAEPASWMGMLQFTKDDIMRGIELGVMALLGLLAMLLVVRPMLRRIMTPEAQQQAAIAAAYPTLTALGLPPAAIAATGAAGTAPAAEQAPLPPPPPSRTSAMIEIAQVQGQVHAQSVQKVGDLADKNPNETAAIVRAWLHENAA
ncbi:flagellar basal-body MS-ring/collar protein FliF [Rhodoplanes sp. Z2-YC6860]|uniref:flagellar basal-body MS-ring/collar protein FliF n=1 Tax=Rhodoplanes sp. Z2-YC6860 TaxID=674703 RepID=UPI00078B49D1|nr:flagellar basal-body MS-ring/collar protein FliF [Rhodoplanes sp. Z2-YC6860]AMN44295.1 flagellar M-ring protein FliF [Rhodoplanes sp. Z2-YC6860]